MAKKDRFTQVLLLDDLVGRPVITVCCELTVINVQCVQVEHLARIMVFVGRKCGQQAVSHAIWSREERSCPRDERAHLVISHPDALTYTSQGIRGTRSHSLVAVI